MWVATILAGVFVCLLGIAAAGVAGICKERVMSFEEKQAAIKEFNLKKGIGVAILSGVMSACFAYGLAAGSPIKALSLKHGTPTLWQGLPVLVVVLIGGFTTNLIWCLGLNSKNKTGFQYFSLAGTTWYFQFFFYTMGETQMGRYGFSSWTLHMASIIIFSTLWGLGFKEWRGAGAPAMRFLSLALALLVGSTVIVGYGNFLAAAVAR